MFYGKGKIIPRSLIKTKHRKAQHNLKFGCDVDVIGKKIIALTDGYIFDIPLVVFAVRKNGTKQKSHTHIEGLDIVGLGNNRSSLIRNHRVYFA